MIRRYYVLVLCILVLFPIQAQRSKIVLAEGLKMGSDVTVVTQEALYEAKRNALLEAGVAESVHSQGIVFIGTDSTVVREHEAAELSLIMLDGRVRVKRAECDTNLVNGMVQVKARIHAEVLMDELDDEEFRVRVSGLQPVYREGEAVEFDIEASKDYYLRIFWFAPPNSPQSIGNQLYPMAGKYSDRLFHADSVYHFPKLPQDCLVGNPQRLEPTNDGTALVEYNVLFVVALKKKIPYDRPDYSYEHFLQWLWKIRAKDRTMQYGLIGIVK